MTCRDVTHYKSKSKSKFKVKLIHQIMREIWASTLLHLEAVVFIELVIGYFE